MPCAGAVMRRAVCLGTCRRKLSIGSVWSSDSFAEKKAGLLDAQARKRGGGRCSIDCQTGGADTGGMMSG